MKKKWFSKKMLLTTAVAMLVVSVSSVAFAAGSLIQITAYQNKAISIEVGGKRVNLTEGSENLYPIIYEGRTYVSAKSVAEALGATVKWNASRQVVEITPSGSVPDNAGVPYKDNSTTNTPTNTTPSTPTPNTTTPSTSGTASTNKGTLSDPIKLGTAFTYNDNWNYKEGIYDTTHAQYTVTLKKVTPISREQIAALGFVRPEDDSKVNYVLVDMDLKVKNAQIKAGSDKDEDGYTYLSTFTPDIWGVKTTSGNSIIGSTDYGFDGSLDRETTKVLPDIPKINPGEKGSYEVSGQILMPVVVGEENYFVLQRKDVNLEYDASFIYFKMK